MNEEGDKKTGRQKADDDSCGQASLDYGLYQFRRQVAREKAHAKAFIDARRRQREEEDRRQKEVGSEKETSPQQAADEAEAYAEILDAGSTAGRFLSHLSQIFRHAAARLRGQQLRREETVVERQTATGEQRQARNRHDPGPGESAATREV